MTAPSEVVNASPPGPVNWHLRCVLRIGWLGFPRVGKLYTGTFRFRESNDQSCCKTEAFALTTGLVVAFIDHRMRAMPQEYADESGSRTLRVFLRHDPHAVIDERDRKSTRPNSSHSQSTYA